MNLTETRAALALHDDIIVKGGTFYYCNFHVPKLDKNGRRTGRVQPCGKKRRTLTKIVQHLRKHTA